MNSTEKVKQQDFKVELILVSYLVGLVLFLPHVVSLILSLVIVQKGYIQDYSKKILGKFILIHFYYFVFIVNFQIVILGTVVELVAWLLCAALAWYGYEDCTISCYFFYYGWVSFIFVYFFIFIILNLKCLKLIAKRYLL